MMISTIWYSRSFAQAAAANQALHLTDSAEGQSNSIFSLRSASSAGELWSLGDYGVD